MGCNCGNRSGGRVTSFVVTDASGECLLVGDDGECLTWRTASQAFGAARTASLPDFQVRPR